MADPTKLVDAFAHDAASPNITNPIPETVTPGQGLASFDLGFPPETMLDPSAGGIPPYGMDMNGILFMITSIIAFLNQGNTFIYDGTFAAAIGGYKAGAIIKSTRTDGPGFWLCVADGTTTDPDAGGAGWVAALNYGATNFSTTGGTTTLNAQQYARTLIVVNGALTTNATVILPAQFGNWLMVNNTTGAFTVTVKTAAGAGITVPQGGFGSPTPVYGDGTNIFNATTPLTVAIDQAATPNTLAERTNTGGLAVAGLNTSNSVTAPTVGAVFVQNSAGDGNLLKISLANFIAQLGQSGLPQIRAGTFNCINGDVTVTFGTPFPTGCISVTCTGEFIGWDLGNIIPGSRIAAGFRYHNGNAGLINYIAIGN